MKTRRLIICTALFVFSEMLNGQDVFLTFSGRRASNSVDSVKVENISLGENLTLAGDQVLHLAKIITGTSTSTQDDKKRITFSPNPMNDFSLMEFSIPDAGKTVISINDLGGKEILKIIDYLSPGNHTYRISGLTPGIYIARIVLGQYSLTGSLISISANGSPTAEYISRRPEKNKDSWNINPLRRSELSDVIMHFREGDSLRFTAKSGNFKTIIVDVPDTSKTMAFDFYECIDGDKNNYPVVKAGNHFWMAENLKSTSFNDGTPIRNEKDDNIWATLDDKSIPAFSWYNNKEENKDTYGGLYNNPVVTGTSGKNVCPAGWHVAKDEWMELFSSLDKNSANKELVSVSAGNLLKESGTRHWSCPGKKSSNGSGFTALPGGLRKPEFSQLGERAYFWDGTDGKFVLYCNNSHVDHIPGKNDYGLSVRCVKDEEVQISFAGSGASDLVKLVNIENLATGALLTIKGDQTLYLGHGKGPDGSPFMEYANGQKLKFTGVSDKYSTVMVDAPDQKKTITFNFIRCTDADSNNYSVIRIGSDTWMAENLKTTKFNDGTPIQNLTGSEEWMSLSGKIPAYCWYNNDKSNKDIFGGLYNFYVYWNNEKNVCPVGWHVSGAGYLAYSFTNEWWNLIKFLDPDMKIDDSHLVSETAGIKLKETGNKIWECQDNKATNETGFSAKPGGYRTYNGNNSVFVNLGSGASFWESTGRISLLCDGSVWDYEGHDETGYSIRCVKDTSIIRDVEGNIYEIVSIGSQVWMKENLRTTKLNDGTPIELIKDNDSAWWNSVSPAYCFYPGSYSRWGAIYNWQSVNTGKLCPSGWHVPSDADWTELTGYLIKGGFNYDGTTEGNKIAKAMALPSVSWKSSNIQGAIGNNDYSMKMNASGFSAPPGGYRSNAFSKESNESSIFWSSSPSHFTGDYFVLHFNSVSGILTSPDSGDKQNGWTVRCLKDN
jgi:uncharacterized protein (TIGR02145 family)